jgi:hypothetical protein
MSRQLLGLLGIVLGLFGLAWRLRWLVWVAVAVLVCSVLLRILASAKAKRASREGEGAES